MLEQNLPWLDDVVRARRPERIAKHAKCYTFRHSFATHLLDDGYDIRAVQDLLERRDVTTTMIYTHVPQPRSGRRAQPDRPDAWGVERHR